MAEERVLFYNESRRRLKYMVITAKMVKDLRDSTGAGMMDAKTALVESGGDFEAASDWLRQKGLAKAQKKSGRIAAEGLIGVSVSGKSASILEVNCETDFVAKNNEFQGMVQSLLEIPKNVSNLNELLLAEVQGKTVENLLVEKVASIGEKINIRRYYRLDSEFIYSYVHNSVCDKLGKIGVLIALSSADETLGKNLAMHVAACNPLALRENDLPADVLEREEKVYSEQAKESGKSSEIIENMVKGKLKKFVSEITLVNQNFVMDPDRKVSEVLKLNHNEILGYIRYEVGEGIEKPVDDFVEEVKKTAMN